MDLILLLLAALAALLAVLAVRAWSRERARYQIARERLRTLCGGAWREANDAS